MGEIVVAGNLLGKELRGFVYIGGKKKYLKWLYSHFPKDFSSFWDVCAGSGAVSLSLTPPVVNGAVAKVVINDLDLSIYNFYSMLKGERGQELEDRLFNLKYSKGEWKAAHKSLAYMPFMDQVGLAANTYLEIMSSFSGMRQGYVNKDKDYLTRTTIKNIPEVRKKLQHIEVMNKDFLEILEYLRDDPEAFVYIDVPYRLENRCGKMLYNMELTDFQHFRMLEILKVAKFKWALSGYVNDNGSDKLYDVILAKYAPYREETNAKKMCGGATKGIKKTETKEILWRNYDN